MSQKFLKKKLFTLLLASMPIFLTYHISFNMPPVADVFKNMSEDDIIRQVQEAEKFLQDLQQFGTPEEQAQFNKILEETLNSMSEQDFQDIQNIAQMVEPHLHTDQVQPQIPPTVDQPKAKEEPVVKLSDDALENFKTMITAIISRIDEILQKFDSSKSCKEEVDTRWKNRATLNSLKRQIAQLKITRLAQKLSKKDLSDDEKLLVDSLEKFLKEITEKNNHLVIEDSFGFETKEEEHSYLKQAKSILSIFDNYIDLLLPKLEKFLEKWDPEALQLAKEAAQNTSKAQKDAQDALGRKPSVDARPVQKEPYPVAGQKPNKNYNTGYGYPESYDSYGYPQGIGYPQSFDDSSNSQNPNASAGTPKSGTPTEPKKVDQNLKPKSLKDSSNPYDDIKESVDGYFDAYNMSSENSNVDFMNKDIAVGYADLNKKLEKTMTSNNQTTNTPMNKGTKTNIEGFMDWYTNSFKPYTTKVVTALDVDQKKFIKELHSAPRLCEDIHATIHDMTPDEVKKISPHLDRLEKRFNNYKTAFETVIKNVTTTFENNIKFLSDSNVIPTPSDVQQTNKVYTADHETFINLLRNEIGKNIDAVLAHIDDLKSKIRHKSKRKSKSSTLSQQVAA